MTVDTILKDTRGRMEKSVQHLDKELRGIRTGRASTALIEYVKVDYYGSPTELRELAAISVPEPTMLMVKPFDPASTSNIVKALETADLGLNPRTEGSTIRIAVPAPSAERRRQLMGQVRKIVEDARVAIRNERRDANKHIEQLAKNKDAQVSEDGAKTGKDEVEKMTKKHIEHVDQMSGKKLAEIEDV